MGMTLAFAAALSPAAAQYIPPGSTTAGSATASGGDGAGIPPREALVDRYSEARWNAGPVRLQPWLGIRDAAFVSDSGAVGGELEGEDFTVTAGAGVRAYLKTGSKVFWSAHALPEYVWWQDFERKRRLNASYGAGVFGYLNRLTFEISQRRIEEQAYFSAELQELTSTRRDLSRLALALRLGSRLELFARGRLQDLRSRETESPVFALLDRDEEALELGARYRLPSGLWLQLGLEDRTTDFAEGARNLSHTAKAERLGLGFEDPRLELRLGLASSSLEPEDASELRSADETTGFLDFLWRLSHRLDLLAYARRDLTFSVDPSSSYFIGRRRGLWLDLRFRFGVLGLFGELGEDGFEPLAGGGLQRLDDVTAAGAELRVELGRLASLRLRATRTEYDSNLDAFDREVTAVGLTVEAGAVLERLRLGGRGGGW
jgi:hypothetical protein